MLSQFSGIQVVAIDGEEPDGTHYEYDRNLRATVRVACDGERTPVQELERSFGPVNRKVRAELQRRKSQPERAEASTLYRRGTLGRREVKFL